MLNFFLSVSLIFLTAGLSADETQQRVMNTYRQMLCTDQNRLLNAFKNSQVLSKAKTQNESAIVAVEQNLSPFWATFCPSGELDSIVVKDYILRVKEKCNSLCNAEPKVKANLLLKECHIACAASADGDFHRFQGFLEGTSAMKNIDCGHLKETTFNNQNQNSTR